MNNYLWMLTLWAVIFTSPETLMANPLITQADERFMENTFEGYDAAIALYKNILERDPDNYEANWKCARAYQWYGDIAKSRHIKNWKNICTDYGKAGMTYAAKAVALEPERVEGHFYLGCNAGTYADGASIFALLKESIIDKIQTSLEKAYKIDKTFDHGGVMQAIGHFHFVLPWPQKDTGKALSYLRENQILFPDDPCGQVFLAEILLKSKNKADIKEAKQLLNMAVHPPDPSLFSPAVIEIYSGMAKKMLKDLE